MTQDREFYHTFEQYGLLGLEQFLEHSRMFLQIGRNIPVSKPNRLDGFPQVTFTYSNDIICMFLEEQDKIRKSHDVAMRYGFRGYSAGEQNGIYMLRQGHDLGLYRGLETLTRTHIDQIVEDLDITADKTGALQEVKIVCHQPNGERVIGVYNQENQRMIFLGFGHY